MSIFWGLVPLNSLEIFRHGQHDFFLAPEKCGGCEKHTSLETK